MNPSNSGQKEDIRASQIRKRIADKIKNYNSYSFTKLQDDALKTFFDLAQEFEEQQDFYLICVLIPQVFFQLNCSLCLINSDKQFEMVCSSASSTDNLTKKSCYRSTQIENTVLDENCFAIPIKGKGQSLENIAEFHQKGVFGIFEIHSVSVLTDHTNLFFEKYVNRIGYQLHNRFISEKNREHLQFIKNLVNDIGHNVIVPNMYFKLFYKRLKGKIDRANTISQEMIEQFEGKPDETAENDNMDPPLLAQELSYVNQSMGRQFQEILSHYEQTSLFLETLLRRSHFEQGQYVIEPKKINFRKKIIRPQLDRYIPQLEERGIKVDNQLLNIPDDEFTVVADVGLISQAYANYISNAVKYTRAVIDINGFSHKFVTFEMEVVENCFGEGKEGLKLNVFSTGPHIPSEDIPSLFEEGYRGNNVESEYGTGHGLQFVKEVIELHGGIKSYEPTDSGNNFYFILPR